MNIFPVREHSPMKKTFKLTLFFYLLINIFNISISNEKFFDKALELYENKKYEDARFMFERNIVFNPKDSKSYLYLAKIYNHEKDKEKEEKNLEATLLIEPNNEEAILMLIKIALEKSNYLKVKDLSKNFIKICEKLCDENKSILETLENIEPKNNNDS